MARSHVGRSVATDPRLLDARLIEIAEGRAEPRTRWEWRDAVAVKVLLAMRDAGLTAREMDVYWLVVGCLWSLRAVERQFHMRHPAGVRAFERAEGKLASYVRRKGITASPLYRVHHRAAYG